MGRREAQRRECTLGDVINELVGQVKTEKLEEIRMPLDRVEARFDRVEQALKVLQASRSSKGITLREPEGTAVPLGDSFQVIQGIHANLKTLREKMFAVLGQGDAIRAVLTARLSWVSWLLIMAAAAEVIAHGLLISGGLGWWAWSWFPLAYAVMALISLGSLGFLGWQVRRGR